MKIEHIAFWVNDIEAMKKFYTTYFGMACNNKYINPKKQFESYFLSFDDSSARIELMRRADTINSGTPANTVIGLVYFAISVGCKEEVDALTEG